MKGHLSCLLMVILLLLSAGCLGEPVEDETIEVNKIELEKCEDDSASNFNQTGPCKYPTDTNTSQAAEDPVVRGCTDPEAENYDDTATEDDGSCTYPPPCTDSDGDGVCAEDDACDDNPEASTEDECETEDK